MSDDDAVIACLGTLADECRAHAEAATADEHRTLWNEIARACDEQAARLQNRYPPYKRLQPSGLI